MFERIHRLLAGSIACLLAVSHAVAQQPALPQQPGQQPPAIQPGAQQAPVLQPPPGFQLNALQQAALNQVLTTWQAQSGKIETFKCTFERWEYNIAFGPAENIPLHKDRGELSYGRPDKGSFQITEINVWQEKPVSPGQQPPAQPPAQVSGDWVRDPNAIGEHWVSDGESIFEYRHQQKQLVERPIPPQLQGQAIADGPLPFLFGANPAQLQARYWLRLEQKGNQNQIWLTAVPKFQAQAADFRQVEVILDRQRMLPTHMQVQLPNRSRHVYMFDIDGASINSPLARLQNWIRMPRLPAGWKRIVEEIPVAQAAQPVRQQR